MTDVLERLTSALAGRYTIERELGRGGMAVVYLAHDERHQRSVALKVMLPEVVGEVGAERFRREIQIAARLTHPHILTVFDSGEAGDLFFYVMPFVEGESLHDAIARERQLGIAEAVALTRQVAEALDYAHSEGVVHRDIKPANILLTRARPRTGGGGGRGPVVTDFGIARAMTTDGGTRLTSTGLALGTPTYMSPEQFGSDYPVDGRSDQYSLACVLYEMLIGEPPFSGPTPMVVLARHTMEMVPSLRIVRPTVPEALEQAIYRAMAKVPGDRFESIADFADAIAAATEGGIAYGTADHAVARTPSSALVQTSGGRGVSARGAPQVAATGYVHTSARGALLSVKRWSLKRRAMVVGSGVVALLAVGAASWRAMRPTVTPPTKLMVLPFENQGPVGDSTFADGLTEEIISRLSGVQRLSVVARASAMKYKGTKKSLKEIGQELQVTRLVTGTVKWRPGGATARQAIVRVAIVNAADETEKGLKDFDAASLSDLYSIADEIAATLDVTMGDKERARLLEHPTENRAAYEAYQQGNRFYNHSWDSTDVNASIVSYETATRLDPRFALALAALGRAHGWKYQLGLDPSDTRLVFAKAFIDSALRLAPELPEARLALGLYYYWGKRDYQGAMREFGTVHRALPSSAEVFNFMGNVSRRRGALKDAVESYRLSAELDPKSHQPLFNRAETLLYLREFAESERLTDRVIDMAPDFIDGYLLKATLQIHRRGDVAAARRILADLESRIPPPRWRRIGHHWRAGLFRIVDDSLSSAERRIVVNAFGLDTAHYLLARANMYRQFGQSSRAHVYYDSAADYMEKTVKRHPEWGGAFGQLGIAYAGLQRKEDAGRVAEKAAAMLNETIDALDGPEWVANTAFVYASAGDADKAIAWLTRAMAIPSRLSPKWIELDPGWVPLRGDARFRRLIREPPPLRSIATIAH